MTFLTLINALTKYGAFFLYAAISFGFVIFFYIYLPETRGVSLEDTTKLFSDDLWGKQNGMFGVTLVEENTDSEHGNGSHE